VQGRHGESARHGRAWLDPALCLLPKCGMQCHSLQVMCPHAMHTCPASGVVEGHACPAPQLLPESRVCSLPRPCLHTGTAGRMLFIYSTASQLCRTVFRRGRRGSHQGGCISAYMSNCPCLQPSYLPCHSHTASTATSLPNKVPHVSAALREMWTVCVLCVQYVVVWPVQSSLLGGSAECEGKCF